MKIFLELIEELLSCFASAIDDVKEHGGDVIEIPVSKEDDEAELQPLTNEQYWAEFDLDNIPF